MSEPSELSPPQLQSIRAALDELGHLGGALLPILHRIQQDLGWIPPGTASFLAHGLNLSIAEVEGVISFYHDFRTTAPGRRVVKVCRAEACQAHGGDVLAAHIKGRLGIDFHETSDDDGVTLEPVYCLGNCACAPSVVLDARLYGRMNPQRFDRLWEGAKS